MLDLVDIIADKKFIGQEFLTWLWYKSEERGGAVFLAGEGDIQVVFEKHMLLESGTGESREKLICQGLQTELREARTGLRMGKKLEKARILLARGDYEWNLSLSATLFEYRNVRLPKTLSPSEESSDPMAVEGKILERLGMAEEAVRTIDELFRMFLKIRISAEWSDELAKLKAWVHRSVGN
jgi:recombination associated protein RdgC